LAEGEAFQAFMAGPAGEGMKASGVPMPDDVNFTPLLNGDNR
jgi:hypothetical protein